MKINKKELGNRLSNLRKSKNISMDELAHIIGVSGRSTINGWEKGRSLPPKKYFEKLVNYFNVPYKYLQYGSKKDFLINILTDDIWNDETPYTHLQSLIWSYVTIKNYDTNGILTSLSAGFQFGFDDGNSTFHQTKKRMIKHTILPLMDELLNLVEEKNIDYEENKIVDISENFFQIKLNELKFTFEGKINSLKNKISEIIEEDYTDVKYADNYEDFEIAIKELNIKYKDEKSKINDYFNSKFLILAHNISEELDKLRYEYQRLLDKHDLL